VGIPYRDAAGKTLYVKRRTALRAGEGSFMPKGSHVMPYGLERLQAARDAGDVVLVEGESDCWTLWSHGIPALGIPGAKSTKALRDEHLAGIGRVYAVQETDPAGAEFVNGIRERLKTLSYHGEFRVLHLGVKDVNELHKQNPDGFRAAFDAALKDSEQSKGPEKPAETTSAPGPGEDAPSGGPPPIDALLATEAEIASARLAPKCIVEDYIFADVRTVPGPCGTGKTTLLAYEAVHIVLGMLLYGLEVKSPGPVLFVTAEDPRETIIARIRCVMDALGLSDRAKAHAWARLPIWDVRGTNRRLAMLDPAGNIALTTLANEIVSAYQDANLAQIIFDPVVSFSPGERFVNDGDQALVMAGRHIVRGLDCCVCFPQHTGKINARLKTLDQYSGRNGSALPDGSRMVHVLQSWEDDDTRRTPPYGFTLASEETALILARPKGTYCKPQPRIWLKRKGYAFEHFIEIRKDKGSDRRAYADQLYAFLTSELKQTPPRLHTRTSLDACDIMQREHVRAAVSDLEVSGRVIHEELPEHLKRGGRQTYLKPVPNPAGIHGGVEENPASTPPSSTTPPPYREKNGGGVEPPPFSSTPPESMAGFGGVGGVEHVLADSAASPAQASWVSHWVRNRKTGARGRVLEDRGDTLHVHYEDGRRAWVRRSEIELWDEPAPERELSSVDESPSEDVAVLDAGISASDLILRLVDFDVRIEARGTDLLLSGGGYPPPGLLDAIEAHKAEVLTALAELPAPVVSPPPPAELLAVQGIEGELVITDAVVSGLVDAWHRHLAGCKVCSPGRVCCDDGGRLYGEVLDAVARIEAQSKAGIQTGAIPTFEDLHGKQDDDMGEVRS
jgi:RecA-family ATPase